MNSKQPTLKEKIKEAIQKILPPVTIDLDEVKDEVWTDLSRIYYKYEDESQKRAFREIMKEIASKLDNGEWQVIYRKIYKEKE